MLALTLSVLLAAVQGDEPQGPSPIRRAELEKFARAEGDVADAISDHRPWLDSRRGSHRPGAGAGGIDSAGVGQYSTRMADAARELRRIDARHLPVSRRLEYEWVLATSTSEAHLASDLRALGRDPIWRIEALDSALTSILDVDPATSNERHLEVLYTRLLDIPRACESGRASLREIPLPWRELALARIHQVERLLGDRTRSWILEAGGSDSLRTSCGAARVQAAAELKSLRAWVAQRHQLGGDDPQSMSPGRWIAHAELATGVELDVDSLRRALLLEIESRTRRLGSQLEVEAMPEAPWDEAELLEGLRSSADTIAGYARSRGLQMNTGESLPWSVLPKTAGWRPTVELIRSGPESWRVEVRLPGPSWPADARARRLGSLAPSLWPSIASGVGSTGEALLRSTSARGTTVSRTRIPNPHKARGFRLYAQHAALELAWVRGERSVHAAALDRACLESAALLLASLDFHERGVAFDDVISKFSVYTGWTPYEARLGIAEVVRNPSMAFGFLEYREMMELEKLELNLITDEGPGEGGEAPEEGPDSGDSARDRGRMAVDRTLKVLLSHPVARTADLRREIGNSSRER